MQKKFFCLFPLGYDAFCWRKERMAVREGLLWRRQMEYGWRRRRGFLVFFFSFSSFATKKRETFFCVSRFLQRKRWGLFFFCRLLRSHESFLLLLFFWEKVGMSGRLVDPRESRQRVQAGFFYYCRWRG